MKIAVKQDYAQMRRAAYPSIADQLDALWKHIAAQAGTKDPAVQTMLDTITAIKARYPKRT